MIQSTWLCVMDMCAQVANHLMHNCDYKKNPKFHALVPVRFLNGWKTGDIIQKLNDVTHFMEGFSMWGASSFQFPIF